jgi:RNA polymerase sigma-70 factor (ECF subfamily)
MDQFTDTERSTSTIREMVLEARQGNPTAMGELFMRFQRQVQTIAFHRLGNWDEALELSQDVFIQASRRLHQLHEPEAFGSWLRMITHRLAINRLTRRRQPLAVAQDSLDANCGRSLDPLSAILDQERVQHLRAGLGSLRRLDRQTLEAFYLEGQSLVEMSDVFEAPVGTIKRRLHVARKRLARAVETLQAV